jgi:hypothetical protein
MDEMSWFVLIYIFLSVIILAIAGLIFRGILRRIGAAWSLSGTLFGDDTKTRLIGLGASALLFPRVFTAIANFLVGFLYQFFVEAPRVLSRPENLPYCVEWQECFAPVAMTFIQTWTSAISDSLVWLSTNRFPYTHLVFMLATWAIITMIFDIPNEGSGGGSKKLLGRGGSNSLNDPTKQNFVFFATLAFAGYLSIVSIITIPSLQESPSTSEEVKVERLEEQMNAMYIQWRDRVPAEFQQTEVFAELESYLDANPPARPVISSQIARNRQDLNTLTNSYKSLVESATAELENAKSQALQEYETTSSNRKGTQETIEHFSSLVTWYRRSINLQDLQIKQCRSHITGIEGDMQYWSEGILFQLQENLSIDARFELSSALSPFARQGCPSQSTSEPVPGRPELGSNLGAFSNVASWLLKTESISLAQIVGMLGFGLLGSAVSSLVRNNPTRRNKNRPIVGDLEVFIVRGATAAIVVFLAVKGGLAIFTSGSGEPSSYVLLLTCFVAAVFSEDVWKRAGKWLKDRLKDDDDDDGDGEPPKPDEGKKGSRPGKAPSKRKPAAG